MTAPALLQIVFYFAILLLITQPLGAHMVRVFEGERTFLHGALGWLERGAYRILGVDPNRDMKWTTYSVALLAFSLASLLFSYLALRLQGYLPLNPQHFGARQMPPAGTEPPAGTRRSRSSPQTTGRTCAMPPHRSVPPASARAA